MITLRPLARDDQTAVRQLILAGLTQRFGQLIAGLNPDVDDLWGYYVARGAEVVVLTLADEIVGCGVLMPEPQEPRAGRLVRLSVRPDCQGRGLGHLITEHLIEQARRRGYQRLWIETNSDWISALRLYQRCGFVEHHRTHDETFGYTEVQMVLTLTSP